jgi:antitoxin (DNA-binding transcriptional repressor) of toxin-antitoxin stability system
LTRKSDQRNHRSIELSPANPERVVPSVNMLDARKQLSRLVEAVDFGNETEIVIARNGKPAAGLVPLDARPTIRLGLAKLVGRVLTRRLFIPRVTASNPRVKTRPTGYHWSQAGMLHVKWGDEVHSYSPIGGSFDQYDWEQQGAIMQHCVLARERGLQSYNGVPTSVYEAVIYGTVNNVYRAP